MGEVSVSDGICYSKLYSSYFMNQPLGPDSFLRNKEYPQQVKTLCKIWGSHGGDDVDVGLMGRNALWIVRGYQRF
jgi:hypothetical protein